MAGELPAGEIAARVWAGKVVGDPSGLSGFNAFMDAMEARVYQEWRAGAFDDWSMAWAELDAIKRLRYAVISYGELNDGKTKSDNPGSKRARRNRASGGEHAATN